MNATCPVCGAPLAFRFDDSFVRICAACKSAVVRGDRGLETMGKVGDLTPIDSPLRLFADGRYGSQSFLLVGMAQIRHGAGGLWQEWYARFDGTWAWVSEAQGRFFLMFEKPGVTVPSFEAIAPGAKVAIAGHEYTVGEVDVATFASALGEIPYRLDPASSFRFVDLADGHGGTATIDYGAPDGSDEPTVYVGQQVPIAELAIRGGEVQHASEQRTQGRKLACPNCNGALELRAPDQTLRVGCPYCDHLISVERGLASVLAKQPSKPQPRIALGSKATFSEGELTVIGYLRRSAFVANAWWPFHEYLLYAPTIGYRWLVQSDGHWSYVQPLAPGAVQTPAVFYEGATFDHYQVSNLRVDEVHGEFYWRVEIGERVASDDYIAPPAMLSCERGETEVTWSLSSYVTLAELERALGAPVKNLDPPIGIAPNQPYPLAGIGTVASLAFGLLFVLAVVRSGGADDRLVFSETLQIPMSSSPALPADAAEAPSNVVFTEPFALRAGDNVAIETHKVLVNDWAYVAIDLVNEQTGGVISFDANLEYYSGVSDGESWSEGSFETTQYLAPLEAGTYVMRLEGQQGAPEPEMAVRVTVRQDVFRGVQLWFALGALGVLFLGLALHALRFKKKRWENSSVRPSGGDDE